MFAILISAENIPKILEDSSLAPFESEYLEMYLRRPTPWYFVRGYVPQRGEWKRGFTVLPAYIFPENFEYDPVKIQTDWDQIVRKVAP